MTGNSSTVNYKGKTARTKQQLLRRLKANCDLIKSLKVLEDTYIGTHRKLLVQAFEAQLTIKSIKNS